MDNIKIQKFKEALINKKNETQKSINSLKNTNEESQGLLPL
jgi:hypothetical protein